MRLTYLTVVRVSAVILLATVTARANTITFNFILDASQEVQSPAVVSPGTGAATVVLDDVSGNVTVTSSFINLVANATAAHIHGLAPAGQNAGILIPLTVTPGMAGTVTGTGTLSPANIAGMIAGQTYLNVHSSTYPGGEIRGQVVPEPTTLALLAVAAVPVLRRARRRS